MPTVTANNIQLYYEDYGSGKPIILIHGWPLTHRAWEPQIPALVEAGHRVIAYDRRGFGQSDKPWDGYDYDTLTDDLNGLIDALDLHDVTLCGFSMGGGEVVRYLARHGSTRVRKAMLIASAMPFMLQTPDNPEGVDASIFEGMKDAVRTDRFALIHGWREAFSNADLFPDIMSQGRLDFMSQQAAQALPQAMLGCIDAFGTTDFRDDLRGLDVPLLVVHGDDDRICPAEVCAKRVPEYYAAAQLEIIAGGPHGLNVTHKEQLNALMLDFLK